MQGRNRRKELAQHTVDRRRREDDAQRLITIVPTLTRLSLSVEERPRGVEAGAKHVRRVVVESASALFEVPCSAGDCHGGVHDASSLVMRELRGGAEHFEEEASCDRCGCVMRYVGRAEYGPQPGVAQRGGSLEDLKKA